jgi:hypothetical protein
MPPRTKHILETVATFISNLALGREPESNVVPLTARA